LKNGLLFFRDLRKIEEIEVLSIFDDKLIMRLFQNRLLLVYFYFTRNGCGLEAVCKRARLQDKPKKPCDRRRLAAFL